MCAAASLPVGPVLQPLVRKLGLSRSRRGPRVLFIEATAGRGGSASCLARFVPNLRRLGVIPSVLVYGMSEKVARLEGKGIAVRSLGLGGRMPRDWIVRLWGVPCLSPAFFTILRGAVEAIGSFRPEIVHLNTPPYAHLPCLVAAKLLGRPVVCHLREIRPLLRVERAATSLVEAYIVLTDEAIGFFADQGIPRGKLFRVHDAIDLDWFDAEAANAAPGEPAGEFRLIVVAALIELKGHRYLLEAVRRLLPILPRLRLACVGDGELRSDLERLARDLGIDRAVSFLGFSNHVPALLKGSDCLVLPSVREGFSQAVIEAMAAAKPVIVSDLLGLRRLVREGETGFLVPPADPDALAKAIEAVAGSPDRFAAMGRRGRALLEAGAFSPDEEAQGILSVLGRVAARRRRPPSAGCARERKSEATTPPA